ncbi:Hypothetical protein POVR1_LOCUS593 [uncultured virus]|nr:Hypothetical protein POVR1_LOCUS593 [uncultured virus]
MLRVIDFVAQPILVKDLNLQIIDERPIGPLGHSHYRSSDHQMEDEIARISADRFCFTIESNMLLFVGEVELIEMLKIAAEKLVGSPFDNCEIIRYDYPKTTSYYPIYGSDYLYLDTAERKHFDLDLREICRFKPISSNPSVWLAIYEMTIGSARRLPLETSDFIDENVNDNNENVNDENDNDNNDNDENDDDGEGMIDPPTIIMPYRQDGITSFHGAAVYDVSFIHLKERKFIERIKWRIKRLNQEKIGWFEKNPDRKALMEKFLPAWNLQVTREVDNYCYVKSNHPRGLLGMSGGELTHWLADAYHRIVMNEHPITMIKFETSSAILKRIADETGIDIRSASNQMIAINAKSLEELELVMKMIGYDWI